MPVASPVPQSADAVAKSDWIIRMEHVTKRFPGVTANRDVHLHVRPGAFHAVIGENGAGKSTLLNILYGRYAPDDGTIFLRDKDLTGLLTSPAAAIRHGIGLVSQHHALIPALTVLENVMLGAEEPLHGPLLRPDAAAQRVRGLAAQLGLGDLDLNLRAERLSVAAQQKIEILKALYRKANVLLLDEPTAMLAPQEADVLFTLLHSLVGSGTTIVFVTHKLREVMAHSTAITVLRAGHNAGDFLTAETSKHELLGRMIGGNREPQTDFKPPGKGKRDEEPTTPEAIQNPKSKIQNLPSVPLLRLTHLTALNARRVVAVQGAELELRAGEIVGIAGVDGSGQHELAEAVVGLRRMETGQLLLEGADITRLNVRERQERGIAYIPEDRHHVGMVLDFTVAENYLLGHERQAAWGGGLLLHPQAILANASNMIERYRVRIGDRRGATPARALSGGNQQKVVIARALDSSPRLLVACQPTRGLDVGAASFVYEMLRAARDRGLGVLLFSLDLDELFTLSDRIVVMFNGRIAGILPRAAATPEAVGALMTGAEIGNPQISQMTPMDADASDPEDPNTKHQTPEHLNTEHRTPEHPKGDTHD
jgi:general nucleoside transport system ATP-binding protein